MYCTHCGNQLKKNAKFCSACGTAAKGKTSQEKNANTKKAQTTAGKGVRIPMPLLVAGGVLILFLGFLIFQRSGNQVAQQQPAQIDQTMQSKVFAVAENFQCPCGECNDNLSICDCNSPNGAMEVKGFILKGLEQGKTVEQLKQAVAIRYPKAT